MAAFLGVFFCSYGRLARSTVHRTTNGGGNMIIWVSEYYAIVKLNVFITQYLYTFKRFPCSGKLNNSSTMFRIFIYILSELLCTRTLDIDRKEFTCQYGQPTARPPRQCILPLPPSWQTLCVLLLFTFELSTGCQRIKREQFYKRETFKTVGCFRVTRCFETDRQTKYRSAELKTGSCFAQSIILYSCVGRAHLVQHNREYIWCPWQDMTLFWFCVTLNEVEFEYFCGTVLHLSPGSSTDK